jgi:hypothetical protein
MKTKWWRWAAIALAIVAVSYPAAWVMVQNSDAYELAESFVTTHPRVREAVGTVHRITLPPFGYALEYTGAQGEASFELSVQAERESATAYVELQRRGVWEVKLARLVRADKTVIDLAAKQ